MNKVYLIQTEDGNEYKLQVTTERSGLIADSLLDKINAEDIEVVEVGLGRTNGSSVTHQRVLMQIEHYIADMFLSHPNVIISFFCDFIHFVPSMSSCWDQINGTAISQYAIFQDV